MVHCGCRAGSALQKKMARRASLIGVVQHCFSTMSPTSGVDKGRAIVKSPPGIARIPGPLADLGFNSPLGIVLWTIGLGTSVRLLCAATAIDLSYGEAYYVATARHFALSYFDHPPLSFWLVGATMKLTGSDALFVLRMPFIFLFA